MSRDGVSSPDPRFDLAARTIDAIQVDTSDTASADVASKILETLRDPFGAGLNPTGNSGVRVWKKQEKKNKPLETIPDGAQHTTSGNRNNE